MGAQTPVGAEYDIGNRVLHGQHGSQRDLGMLAVHAVRTRSAGKSYGREGNRQERPTEALSHCRSKNESARM